MAEGNKSLEISGTPEARIREMNRRDSEERKKTIVVIEEWNEALQKFTDHGSYFKVLKCKKMSDGNIYRELWFQTSTKNLRIAPDNLGKLQRVRENQKKFDDLKKSKKLVFVA